MLKTANGGFAACGSELDYTNTTREERAAILDREARNAARRKALPRRRTPDYMKPGPVTHIDMRGTPWA